jgi:hypothetical protein
MTSEQSKTLFNLTAWCMTSWVEKEDGTLGFKAEPKDPTTFPVFGGTIYKNGNLNCFAVQTA